MVVHIGTKNYHCEQCDKQFARQRDLKSYLLTHTVIKSYQCGQRDEKFATQGYWVHKIP